MVKNLVYDYELRKQKFEQDNKKLNPKTKYKIKIENKGLPSDYDPNRSMEEKNAYLQRRLPPWKPKVL